MSEEVSTKTMLSNLLKAIDVSEQKFTSNSIQLTQESAPLSPPLYSTNVFFIGPAEISEESEEID